MKLQVDVGFGDAITPEASLIEFPPLLDFPAPRLRAYPRETVVAEKLEAIVQLGMANSRMKDFYDIAVLAREFAFDGDLLARAIRATFERRKTDLPTTTPTALTEAFAGIQRRTHSGLASYGKRAFAVPVASKRRWQPLRRSSGHRSTTRRLELPFRPHGERAARGVIEQTV